MVIGTIHHTNRELSLEDKNHPLSPLWRKIIYYLKCMKKISQLNGSTEWGNTARQQHRFYSIFGGGGICLLTDDRDVMKILELYEK